jgi:hypothetical protein
MQVGFHYGALSEPLEKQANEQGYTIGKKAEAFERCKDAIITLMFSDILTDSQIDKAYQKLNKKVTKALKPYKEEI